MRTRWIVGVILMVVAGVMVSTALAANLAWRKEKLPRDTVYYEINNDNGDHGNFIETYHVPNGRGGKVYCVVYSDQIADGGGAGIDCDWEHSGR